MNAPKFRVQVIIDVLVDEPEATDDVRDTFHEMAQIIAASGVPVGFSARRFILSDAPVMTVDAPAPTVVRKPVSPLN